MEIIRSTQNAFIKRCAALKQKKNREEAGVYLVEGERLVGDTIAVTPAAGVVVLLSESYYTAKPDAFRDYERVVAADHVFIKATDTVNTQGIAALVPIPKPTATYDEPLCLYLDGVRDPGNVGAILRTACAAGFNAVYLRNCSDAFNPKAVRSAMSATARLKIIDADACELDNLAAHGYTLLCGDIAGENLFSAEFSGEKYCLLIGGEADGFSAEVKARALRRLTVPMAGGIESLNAAVSAGILMYQIAEKRR